VRDLPSPTAVVCHDAGATNIVLAHLKANPGHPWLPVMQGPALALWQGAGLPYPLQGLEQAVAQSKSVLSGTGWTTGLEHHARLLARARGLPSAAVIDHWVNYEARFQRDGHTVMPDEIWVTDGYAFDIATATFPGVSVALLPNLYLQEQVQAVAQHGTAQAGRVLYVLEPIRYTWPGLQQPGEFEALDYFVSHLAALQLRAPVALRLRPHPSDAPGKYQRWMAAQTTVDVALDTSTSLAQAIAKAQWVVGCETAALVVALAAQKQVMSSLPPQAPRCRLPHQGLLHLHEQLMQEKPGLANGPRSPDQPPI
jgi:hypothetical protein